MPVTPHEHHRHDDDEHGHEHAARRGLRGVVQEIFAPHSHDAADSLDTALESSARGIRAVKISFATLLLTSVLQLAVILMSGSVALLADTIHNFSDALTAVPLFIAFRLARRAPTRRYTYGYGRAEDLAGLFVIAMIALSAIVAAVEAVHRLIAPQGIDHLGWVAAAGHHRISRQRARRALPHPRRQRHRLRRARRRRLPRPHRRLHLARRRPRSPRRLGGLAGCRSDRRLAHLDRHPRRAQAGRARSRPPTHERRRSPSRRTPRTHGRPSTRRRRRTRRANAMGGPPPLRRPRDRSRTHSLDHRGPRTVAHTVEHDLLHEYRAP